MTASCQRCRHWSRLDRPDKRYGNCSVIDTVATFNLATGVSAEDSLDCVLTGENFGCIHFQPEETAWTPHRD